MVPKTSRSFRLVPLQYVTKVVDAFPCNWGFLKPSLDLLSATPMAPTPPSGMPLIPTPPQKQATLAASHLEVGMMIVCMSIGIGMPIYTTSLLAHQH